MTSLICHQRKFIHLSADENHRAHRSFHDKNRQEPTTG